MAEITVCAHLSPLVQQAHPQLLFGCACISPKGYLWAGLFDSHRSSCMWGLPSIPPSSPFLSCLECAILGFPHPGLPFTHSGSPRLHLTSYLTQLPPTSCFVDGFLRALPSTLTSGSAFRRFPEDTNFHMGKKGSGEKSLF